MTRVVCDFCMTQAARALEIACDSRKQKLYHENQPLRCFMQLGPRLHSDRVSIFVQAPKRERLRDTGFKVKI